MAAIFLGGSAGWEGNCFRNMKIDCYMSIGCGSEQALRENLETALKLEGVFSSAEVAFRRVNDEEARAMGLRGSPSVLVDGMDIEPADLAGFS